MPNWLCRLSHDWAFCRYMQSIPSWQRIASIKVHCNWDYTTTISWQCVTACDFPQDFGGSAYDLGILSSNLGTFLLCLRKVHFTCNMVVFSHKYTMSKLTVLPSVMILQLLFTFLADLYTPHTQTSRNSFTANCYLILICGKNFTYTDNFGYILGCWQFCLILWLFIARCWDF